MFLCLLLDTQYYSSQASLFLHSYIFVICSPWWILKWPMIKQVMVSWSITLVLIIGSFIVHLVWAKWFTAKHCHSKAFLIICNNLVWYRVAWNTGFGTILSCFTGCKHLVTPVNYVISRMVTWVTWLLYWRGWSERLEHVVIVKRLK